MLPCYVLFFYFYAVGLGVLAVELTPINEVSTGKTKGSVFKHLQAVRTHVTLLSNPTLNAFQELKGYPNPK